MIKLSLLLVPLCIIITFDHAVAQTVFSGCDMSSYYDLPGEGPQDWTRVDLHQLIDSTHRNSLPYTDSDGDDVWKALIDLDSTNTVEGTFVHLIYASVDLPAIPFGEPETWNREHLWPKSRGVETGGKDFTDVHHLRPSDWNVNAARGNLYFGQCGSFENIESCRVPATNEAANDTSADGQVWLPPASVRGDIARAMFYMDLHYDGGDGGLDLVLTDCPSEEENEMAYLSQLLEWHEADPPDDRERERNTRICERWQGNRNPFVDFRELATALFGQPRSILPGELGYNCSAPAVNKTSTCEGLTAGDVMVTMFNSVNPDVVALVALSDIPAGTQLYMTDNAWAGTGFLSNEGILKFVVPDGGIDAGTVFGFDRSLNSSLLFSALWQATDGSFALAAAGDTILLYCQSEDGAVVHLGGLSYSGAWASEGLTSSDYGTSTSALPSTLVDIGSLALAHFDNYAYEGTTTGSKINLQRELMNKNNWMGSNNARISVDSLPTFVVSPNSSAKQLFSSSRVMLLVPLMGFFAT